MQFPGCLVDTINTIIAFDALDTGGAVVVSHYIGRQDLKNARCASKQLMYVNLAAALRIMGFALVWRRVLLQSIYGNIDPQVMQAAATFLAQRAELPFSGDLQCRGFPVQE
jgi:Na+-driven multidrug efflux pump